MYEILKYFKYFALKFYQFYCHKFRISLQNNANYISFIVFLKNVKNKRTQIGDESSSFQSER